MRGGGRGRSSIIIIIRIRWARLARAETPPPWGGSAFLKKTRAAPLPHMGRRRSISPCAYRHFSPKGQAPVV